MTPGTADGISQESTGGAAGRRVPDLVFPILVVSPEVFGLSAPVLSPEARKRAGWDLGEGLPSSGNLDDWLGFSFFLTCGKKRTQAVSGGRLPRAFWMVAG